MDAFYIDKYEVTVGQWNAFVEATGYVPEREITERLGRFRLSDQHPVTFVSHAGAKAYAEWVGKRLPTEVPNGKRRRARCFGQQTLPLG